MFRFTGGGILFLFYKRGAPDASLPVPAPSGPLPGFLYFPRFFVFSLSVSGSLPFRAVFVDLIYRVSIYNQAAGHSFLPHSAFLSFPFIRQTYESNPCNHSHAIEDHEEILKAIENRDLLLGKSAIDNTLNHWMQRSTLNNIKN